MINKYFLRQFLSSFLPIFLTLFLVSSVIVLFQIAKFTSYIELSFFELFKLYSLMSIKLIIFTTPISFFITLFMCILRLCKDNEIVILFSLGYSPRKMANFFSVIAFCVSLFLSLLSFFFIPISFSLYDNFVDYKKAFSKINLKNNGFGQKIGNYIYLSDANDENDYKEIFLYSPQKLDKNEKIILAGNGDFDIENEKIKISLKDVTLYDFNDKLSLAKIKNLTFTTAIESKITNTRSIIEYWLEPARSKELVIYFLLSLMPLACVHYALSFSIISSRYEQSHEYLAILVFLLIYLLPMSLSLNYHFYAIFGVFFTAFFISRFCFKIKILDKF